MTKKLLVPALILTLSLTGIGLAKDKKPQKPVRSADYKQGVVDAYTCIDFLTAKYALEGQSLTYDQMVRICRIHLKVDQQPVISGGGDKKGKKKKKTN